MAWRPGGAVEQVLQGSIVLMGLGLSLGAVLWLTVALTNLGLQALTGGRG